MTRILLMQKWLGGDILSAIHNLLKYENGSDGVMNLYRFRGWTKGTRE